MWVVAGGTLEEKQKRHRNGEEGHGGDEQTVAQAHSWRGGLSAAFLGLIACRKAPCAIEAGRVSHAYFF